MQASAAFTDAAQSAPARTCAEVVSDFKYLMNNVSEDAIDLVTSPLHISEAGKVVTSPRFYLIVGGSAALWGGSFALDQTMKSHLRSMSSSDADMLQNISYGGVGASTALLYGSGLCAGDARAKHYALTAGEGAGIATLVNIGIKAGVRAAASEPAPVTLHFFMGESLSSRAMRPQYSRSPTA